MTLVQAWKEFSDYEEQLDESANLEQILQSSFVGLFRTRDQTQRIMSENSQRIGRCVNSLRVLPVVQGYGDTRLWYVCGWWVGVWMSVPARGCECLWLMSRCFNAWKCVAIPFSTFCTVNDQSERVLSSSRYLVSRSQRRNVCLIARWSLIMFCISGFSTTLTTTLSIPVFRRNPPQPVHIWPSSQISCLGHSTTLTGVCPK